MRMFEWIESRSGSSLAEAPNQPNYLGPYQDQPFPLNPLFRSQPVLDETTKELIYDKVVSRGESLKAVSAEMHVDVKRVAAVVRLKEVEKQWTAEVSLIPIYARHYPSCFAMMRLYKNFRLVLKTFPLVKNLYIF